MGTLTGLVNLAYGHDMDGDGSDGEVRLALLCRLDSRAQVGIDTRIRFQVTTDSDGGDGDVEPSMDLVAGPIGSYILGPVAVLGQVGVSTIRISGQTETGVMAVGGLATTF